MTLRISATVALVAMLGLGACTDPATLSADQNTFGKTEKGAVVGGLVGAGLGALFASNSAKGAAVGAAAGALAGGLIGKDLERQEAELREQLARDEITIRNTGDRLIVTLPEDITFDTDSDTVRPSLRAELNKVAANLVRYPDSDVDIIGHTDSDGAADYNADLSLRRANSVADILQAGGVTYDRLNTIGMGENQPVASNLTDEGKARNRRVEIVVIPKNT